MSEDRLAGKRSGTYLFVKHRGGRGLKAAARAVGRSRPTPAVVAPTPSPDDPRRQRAEDSILEPIEPPSTARLRYIRPRLEPEILDRRLVFFLDPDADAAEHYRAVADRVRAARPPIHRLWVTSPGPRSGKTLTALNLASALAATGRVTLVDLSLADPGVARAFGLEAFTGLAELVRARRRDRRTPVDLLLLADQLAALPAHATSPQVARLTLGTEELRRVLDEVAEGADLLVLDGPSVTDEEAVEPIWALIDAVLLVVRPGELGTGAYEAALETLRERRMLGVLINGAAAGAAEAGAR